MQNFNMEIQTDKKVISLYPIYFTRELLFSIKAGQPILYLDKALKLSDYATKFVEVPKDQINFSKTYPTIPNKILKKINTVTECYLKGCKIATVFGTTFGKVVLNNPFKLYHNQELIYNSIDFILSNSKTIESIQNLTTKSLNKRINLYNSDSVATITLVYSEKIANLDCIICTENSFRKAGEKFTVSIKGKIFMTDANKSGIYKITSEKASYGFAELIYEVNKTSLQLEKVTKVASKDTKRVASINILDRCLYT